MEAGKNICVRISLYIASFSSTNTPSEAPRHHLSTMSRQSQLTNVVQAPAFHSAASKTFQKARASPSTSLSSSPSSTSSPSTRRSQVFSEKEHQVHGVKFDVDFHRVWYNNRRLVACQLSYRVRYKAQLADRHDASLIWRYGVELEYHDLETSKTSRLWLCKACHVDKRHNDALLVNGTAHIVAHMIKQHRSTLAQASFPTNPSPPTTHG